MVKSGLCWNKDCTGGLGFWGPNGHDGVWHLALGEGLKRFSLENPIFAGSALKNYHLGFDFILALVSKITSLPLSLLYFQIAPPILALFIGVLVLRLVRHLTKLKTAPFWALFFVYFGGGFGTWVHLIRYGKLGGDSLFWAQSQATTLVNPPLAFSLVLILLGLVFLERYLEKREKKYFWAIVFFFGILTEIKVYAGLLILASLLVVAVLSFVNEKKLDLFWLFLSVLSLNLILFIPFNRNASSLLEFYPFWYLETMMVFGDRLHWERFYQAMTNYKAGRVYLKAAVSYFIALLIFIVGNLGTRIVAFFGFDRNFFSALKKNYLVSFLTVIIVCGTIVPLFFVQKGTAWNTIQFFYYSLFFLSIFAGIVFGKVLAGFKKPWLNYSAIFGMLILTLPTTVTTMEHYLPSTPPAKISMTEVKALQRLRDMPQGVVLSLQIPGRRYYSGPDPQPLYQYDSTAYISAYSGKPVFLEDIVNLNIMNYDWPARLARIKSFADNPNNQQGWNFLREDNISYIYLVKGIEVVGLNESLLNLAVIFDSEEVIIYKVL